MTVKTLMLTLLAACALGVLSTPAFAETAGTGWEAYSSVSPTNLKPGRATDEVREFKITGAGEGKFRLKVNGANSPYDFIGETPFVAFDATHGEVQADLEAILGAGNVAVSKGGTEPYVVTFTGSLSDQKANYTLRLETEGSASSVSGEQPVVVTKGREDGEIQIYIFNTGAKPSEGSITVTDTLPPGVTVVKAGGTDFLSFSPLGEVTSAKEEEQEANTSPGSRPEQKGPRWTCTGNGSGEADLTGATTFTCTSNPAFLPSLPHGFGGYGIPISIVENVGVLVKVDQNAKEGTKAGAEGNQITVAGGGAASTASTSDPVTISSSEPGFGIPGWDAWFSNADGSIDTQAGSHPYEATFVNSFSELANGKRAGGEPRDLEAVLPPGFFGDPGAAPRCTREQLDAFTCPAQSQIGVDWSGSASGGPGGLNPVGGRPVYNMVPPPGVPDEFAFSQAGYVVAFDAGVRSSHGYPIVEHIDNLPEVKTDMNVLTLWGVPAEESHDTERCEGRFNESGTTAVECGFSSGLLAKPFLTLPTSCEGPQTFTLLGLSTWTDESAKAGNAVSTHNDSGTPTGFTGCEHLTIEPTFSAVPDTGFADTPAGLSTEVEIPQENLAHPGGLVAATLKNTAVTLPEGLVINPGQAAGLVACQAAEANLEGEGPQHCPNASKVGAVKIQTPLLEEEVETELDGNVYVLQSNPPELELLVAASADGIYLKLVGTVHLNTTTGQITTTFNETPELPFTSFKLTFSGGAQAALATPVQCGSYTTSSDFTPWTTPFGANVLGTAGFSITSGPGGGACPSSSLPFAPSLIAGATTDQAGANTNFSLLLQRGDGQQRIENLSFKAPAGLTGELSHVPLCPEPQAQAGTCSSESQIGHTTVASGPGPYPLIVPEPGRPESPIYLTGPYEGAPFGLSIVTPVLAGPFNLGTIVTRARIEVDPRTAQISVTTDPLPQIVDGVPTDLRTVDSVIDRPEFMVNPTNCDSQEFSGTATGTPPPGAGGAGATVPISSHFQVGSCRSLEFKPQVAVSTVGKASKADGESLFFKISYPKDAQGSQAWFKEAKFDLPIQLPARLTTLQQACLAATFEANPAACPEHALIGHATVHTQVLPVPLTGPVYFVSYGGAKFPEAVIVLQGDGVTVDLHGETFISQKGVTSATFRNTPDVPFENIEVTIPQGPFSEFGANLPAKDKYSFCGQSLKMPTLLVAQNGLEIHQETPIAVTGCAKTKTLTRAQKLAAALKACHKKKGAKRVSCEQQARKTHGPVKKSRKR